MERTVPRTDSEEIELYIRTYYSLLRTSGEVPIAALVETHERMESLLHPKAGSPTLDVGAMVYASLRLPTEIHQTRLILLGQRQAVFQRWGYHVDDWGQVSAVARRRRSYFDGQDTLALYIASRSDIDDIVPTLTAYQIEWNKLHRVLSTAQGNQLLADLHDVSPLTVSDLTPLADVLGATSENLFGLVNAWGGDFIPTLKAAAEGPKKFALRLLAGSLADYRKAVRHWWIHFRESAPKEIGDEYENMRVYFVSSNTHSLVNLWSGYALQKRQELLSYIRAAGRDQMLEEYQDIENNAVASSHENFFYYTLREYLKNGEKAAQQERAEVERSAGVRRAASGYGFELDAQTIQLNNINQSHLDPRLHLPGIDLLEHSDAIIINIDYPLGMAAYEMLVRISENVGTVEGVYIMGKSATLNGRVGDVMMPNVVHDEHSQNTYMFNNCFHAEHVEPYLCYGTVLDNQKAVTVRGTFLQNDRYMGVFYREGYTDIEMEAGPYLSASYELMRPKRHPQDEIVSLHPAQFDIGIIHYASDKPLSKGQNLGAGSLDYRGMDPTYAAAVAILRRVISKEIDYLRHQQAIQPERHSHSAY